MKQRNSIKTRKLASIGVAAALAVTVIAATGCTSGDKKDVAQAAATAQEQTIKTVKVQPVSKQKIGEPLEQVADVVAATQLDVIAKASGDIKEIWVKRGDRVNAGDVILRLDPTDMQIQKEKAALQLQSSQQSLAKSRKDVADGKTEMANSVAKMEQALQDITKQYNKARNDYDSGLITKQQLEQMETTWKNQNMDLDLLKQKQKTLETSDTLAALETQVQAASLSIKELDRSIANLDVKAPVSGVLTDMPLIVGMTIQAGTKVGHLQQLDPIRIQAQLTENSAKLVRGKTELVYYVSGSTQKSTAKISYLSDSMDAQSKSYELELEVANPTAALKPGMKVQIQLTTEQEQVVISVPTLSIVREGGESFVFVLNGDTVEKRKVELGRLSEMNQEIISGIKEGDQLVVSGQNQLKDKDKVKLQEPQK
jgi:multidrug efflux pump subunit AcrA (membrane-fusion protein)